MTDEETNDKVRIAALTADYRRLLHAMQTGVAYAEPEKYEGGEGDVRCEHKHLRVGVNAAMCDHAGLVLLLIEKGVITNLEYLEAIRDQMQAEVDELTKAVADRLGQNAPKVTLV